jgi:hypothetical protein
VFVCDSSPVEVYLSGVKVEKHGGVHNDLQNDDGASALLRNNQKRVARKPVLEKRCSLRSPNRVCRRCRARSIPWGFYFVCPHSRGPGKKTLSGSWQPMVW